MRLCTSPLKIHQVKRDARARRANACRRWKRLPKTNILIGSSLSCKSGTARRNAKLKSPPALPSGLIVGSPLCQSVGSLYAIRCMSSKSRLCYAPISKSRRSKSFNGFRDAGKSKLLFMKSELTSASKPNDNGQTYPSSALHQPCSVCSRSSPCSPTYMPRNKSCLSNKLLGMLKSCQLFRTHSLSSSKPWHRKSIFELRQFTAKYKKHCRLAQETALQPQIGHFFSNIFG